MFKLRPSAFPSGYRLRISAECTSCTEAFRKLPLPADLVVWTMPPGFLGARWWGERRDGVLGPRGRGFLEEWKGSTGKWASLCRSRATGHAPRLPSSSLRWGLLSGPSKESKGARKRKARARGMRRPGAAFLTLEIVGRRSPSHDFVSSTFSSCVNWIVFLPILSFARYLHDTLISPRERQHIIHLISRVSLCRHHYFCSYWYIIFVEAT